ncbi:MAG: hypothetical protein PWP07_65 [Epulopiscium sp.]|nr:hypothetical protein [Defluviitalea raffinosedens]MBZ4667033.1 hypothetical protein [Defluviitaleaceae bacterium]MDK2786840.1 hypothetical protein [Candidatus Epulonipiscium sp.]
MTREKGRIDPAFRDKVIIDQILKCGVKQWISEIVNDVTGYFSTLLAE